jgi:hypothetical protein
MSPQDLIVSKRKLEDEMSKALNEAAARFLDESGLTVFGIVTSRIEVTHVTSIGREYLWRVHVDVRLDPDY